MLVVKSRGRSRLGRAAVLLIRVVSPVSLLACVLLIHFWRQSDRSISTLTLCHETAEDEVHVRRSLIVEFGKYVTIKWTWYREDHLIPEQIEVLQEQIAQSDAVEWEETPSSRPARFAPAEQTGFSHHVSEIGETHDNFRVRCQPLILLFALPTLSLLMRGAIRII
jgi:hypothetical protein